MTDGSDPNRIALVWQGKRLPKPAGKRVIPKPILTTRLGKLYRGDNREIATGLSLTFKEKAKLVYLDPPYGVGGIFHAAGSKGGRRDRQAYRDPTGVAEIQSFYELLVIVKGMLKSSGTIWVQCDWRRSAIYRLLLDEVFGARNFINHVVWGYKTGGVPRGRGFARKHDDILVYGKGPEASLQAHRQKSYVPTLPEPHTPSGKRLGVQRDRSCELCGRGAPGQKFRWVIGRDVWDDIPALFRNDQEVLGYDTQKPEALLERIIAAGTRRDDLVMDFFSGSGTTAAVAERMGRRWIAVDKGAAALRVTAKRLKDV
jgi:site-specific DNA-methyltransferase (adenine-specific)/adenine-specific DNA-methyltransferase